MPFPRTAFARRVLALLRRIPRGRVVTYGDLAAMAGQPGAARAVGTLMRRTTEPGLPCHRVIAAGGRIGGFGGDPARKRRLLAAEGIRLTRHRVADFERCRWSGPS